MSDPVGRDGSRRSGVRRWIFSQLLHAEEAHTTWGTLHVYPESRTYNSRFLIRLKCLPFFSVLLLLVLLGRMVDEDH